MILQVDEIEFISHGVKVCGDFLDVIPHTCTGVDYEHDVHFIQFSRSDDMVSNVFECFGERIAGTLTAAFASVPTVSLPDGPDFRNARRFEPVKSATAVAFNALSYAIHPRSRCRLERTVYRFSNRCCAAIVPFGIRRYIRQCCFSIRCGFRRAVQQFFL